MCLLILFIWHFLFKNIYCSSSCSYTYNNGTTDFKLDMSCMNNWIADYYQEPYHFLYSPCRNGDNCENEGSSLNGMVVQSDNTSDPSTCFLIATWDNSGTATYNPQNQIWTVEFRNGQ